MLEFTPGDWVGLFAMPKAKNAGGYRPSSLRRPSFPLFQSLEQASSSVFKPKHNKIYSMTRPHGVRLPQSPHFQRRRRLRTRAPSTRTIVGPFQLVAQRRRLIHFLPDQDDAELSYSGDWTHDESGAANLIQGRPALMSLYPAELTRLDALGTQSWTGDPNGSVSFSFTGRPFPFSTVKASATEINARNWIRLDGWYKSGQRNIHVYCVGS